MTVPQVGLDVVDRRFSVPEEEATLEPVPDMDACQPRLDQGRLVPLARCAKPTTTDNPTASELRSRCRQLVERLGSEVQAGQDGHRFVFSRPDGEFEVLLRHGECEERLRLTENNGVEREIQQELWIGSSCSRMSFREQFTPLSSGDDGSVEFHYRSRSRSGAQGAHFRNVVIRLDGSTQVTTNENGKVEVFVEDPVFFSGAADQ